MALPLDRRELLKAGAGGSLALLSAGALAAPGEGPALSRIAFGSCARQNKDQPIWDRVNAWSPELFIFLGDNIYADTEDMDVMRAKYAQLAEKPGFQQLRRSSRCIAIWDDHDYGVNDGGFEYPKKAESKRIFLDFWGEPADSPRRTREGNYTSYMFGPSGQRVQVILPDNRWFRTALMGITVPPTPDMGPYLVNPDPKATMLGARQWEWLEAEFARPADLRIFASSTQVLADRPGHEAWVNFQADHQRLLDLVRFARVEHLVMISGDTHYAELSRLADGMPYPLHDLTSSGLTEVWPMFGPNANRIAKAPLAPNFGRLTIDWKARALTMEVQMLDGSVPIAHRLAFADLERRPAASAG